MCRCAFIALRSCAARFVLSISFFPQDHEGSSLCSIFIVGQLVSCIVLHVDDDKKEGKGNKKIWLSLRLGLFHKSLTLDAVQEGMVWLLFLQELKPIWLHYKSFFRFNSST